jgi:hypothetical protein
MQKHRIYRRYIRRVSIVGALALLLLLALVVAQAVAQGNSDPLGGLADQARLAVCDAVQPNHQDVFTASWWGCGKFIPARAQQVTSLDGFAGPPGEAYHSLWHVGAVVAADGQSYSPRYVWSASDACRLGVDIPLAEQMPGQYPQHGQQWSCPRDIGPLTITGADAQAGTISFVAADGRRGSFRLEQQRWTFAR